MSASTGAPAPQGQVCPPAPPVASRLLERPPAPQDHALAASAANSQRREHSA